ncbi:MAG: hypothetical protein FJ405_09620 [Verrucomicrobia bacterium]|nr:hypothetical protein [Verrucomicrobiota bacterium]
MRAGSLQIGWCLVVILSRLIAMADVPQVPPPVFFEEVSGRGEPVSKPQLAADPQPWDIGSPTDDEQLYVEYINRARLDPRAEALRLMAPVDPDIQAAYAFFNVNTNLLVSQFAGILPAPPVAIHAVLTRAAREHSTWMLVNGTQTHEEAALSSGDRIAAAGYPWKSGGGVGENIFAFAKSVVHGHFGFNTDWGNGPGGMQSPPGHRNTIHDRKFREIGVGVVYGTNTGPSGTVGPGLVTQEFGYLNGARPYVTGVAFYDFNNNGFYDTGEGLGGIRVELEGATHYATTTRSGGYAIPFASGGVKKLTFSGAGFSKDQRLVNLVSGTNLKADFTPPYVAPTVKGPLVAPIQTDSLFLAGPFQGASRYRARVLRFTPATATEGAEGDLSPFHVSIAPGYSLRVTDVRHEGAASFHMAHPFQSSVPSVTDQTMEFKDSFGPRSGSQLLFFSRLGWASPLQAASVRVSSDEGRSWQTIWSRAGTGNAGESAFSQVALPLSAYAGKSIRVRFVYTLQTGGGFFPQTQAGVGWYIDSIRFTSVDRAVNAGDFEVPSSGEFLFRPSDTLVHELSVRAETEHRTFPYGPPIEVTGATSVPSAEIALDGFRQLSASRSVISYRLIRGTPTSVLIQGFETLTGPRTRMGGVVRAVGGQRYEIEFDRNPGASTSFFQLLAQ